MKRNKKRVRKAFLFIKGIIRKKNKKIITPITKFILLMTDKMGRRTDKFERWSESTTTLCFSLKLFSKSDILFSGGSCPTMIIFFEYLIKRSANLSCSEM